MLLGALSKCLKHWHLPLDQVAQSPIQPGLEHFQGGGIGYTSRKPVPGFDALFVKNCFLMSSLNLRWCSFEPFPRPVTGSTETVKYLSHIGQLYFYFKDNPQFNLHNHWSVNTPWPWERNLPSPNSQLKICVLQRWHLQSHLMLILVWATANIALFHMQFPVFFLASSYIKVVALKPSTCGMQLFVMGHSLCVKLTTHASGLAWFYSGLPGVLLQFVLFYEQLSNSFGNYLVR